LSSETSVWKGREGGIKTRRRKNCQSRPCFCSHLGENHNEKRKGREKITVIFAFVPAQKKRRKDIISPGGVGRKLLAFTRKNTTKSRFAHNEKEDGASFSLGGKRKKNALQLEKEAKKGGREPPTLYPSSALF